MEGRIILTKDLLSIVVPCYNEEEMIPIFVKELKKQQKIMEYLDFEILFINDGSSDNTLSIMKNMCNKFSNIKYLSFSRNFGKEAALYAGLQYSQGEYIVVMDVDLQDPPELLEEMYYLIKNEEYDCIGTRRKDRHGEPPIRSFFAKQFYKLISKISDTNIVDGARDYRMMTKQMVSAVLEVSEYNRFSKGIFSWVGFKTKYLDFENKERVTGNTSWSFWKLFSYSLDGIVAFSEVPLTISTFVGFITFTVAIILAIFFAIRTVIFGNPTSGWTSLIVILLGSGGVQLLCLGILGKYIGKIFIEAKHRPKYILKESNTNLPKDHSWDDMHKLDE